MPSAWRTTPRRRRSRQDVDSTIYELHIRDYSMSDAKVPAAKRGSYLAFAENGDGRAHLKALAKAGLNTVHLLPSFDIASIEEDPAKQQTPQCDLASYAPDSDRAAEVRRRRRGQGRLQLGLRPLPLQRPGRLVRVERRGG